MAATVKSDKMSVKTAIKAFTDIMRSLNETDQQIFLSFIADSWRPEEVKVRSLSQRFIDGCPNEHNTQEEQLRNIRQIVIDIRNRVPFDGILPSENIVPPTIGQNSDCDAMSTKHFDAFLYDNNEVVELIEEGKLDSQYCAKCGSTNVKLYNIISHSMSVSTMIYVFSIILPSLEGKTVLDIGSRLGAVLYGAHIFSSAQKIIGVEMNKDLCTLQSNIIHKYKMNDRIEIINKRIEECPDIVQRSNIIIMNNPFEFYVPESVHVEIWKFLKANIQKGTILITRPAVETTFKTLNTGILVKKWLKPCQLDRFIQEPQVFGSLVLDPNEHCDISLYEVR
ncbi:uncharacterized protein LOC116435118 [Nomia melanderi]|uniref:uncharacterized protein LOC116435118 n=1 Tax=Nomia melanderi TaxID=2448451 RepID=UPI0013046D03|nr:uncharacterized protein LOC116435118 [Nomia melanderi]XP_031850208.1 uncharacterized protein LOC116435118 [Nomia melanderi]XP_031850209.1 uncharacterized protein LOC116435118 [Nomia melanderi]XP_031850211.1 uncharacterized protein LOC116435118 [Nomia melanderi]